VGRPERLRLGTGDQYGTGSDGLESGRSDDPTSHSDLSEVTATVIVTGRTIPGAVGSGDICPKSA